VAKMKKIKRPTAAKSQVRAAAKSPTRTVAKSQTRAAPKSQSRERAWLRRAEHRPQEILAAARVLLEQHGYAAVSMAQIARRAGVSEATVYKYFKNKQDLMNQVLHEWATPFTEYLQREIVLRTDLRAKLTLVGIRYLRSLEQTPRLHEVVFQELRWNGYYGSSLHKLNQQFVRILVEAIRDAIDRGEAVEGTNPLTVRDMLFGGLEHIALRTMFAGRPMDIETEVTTLVEHLLSGISPRTTATLNGEDVSQLMERLQKALASLQQSRISTTDS